MPLLEVGHLDAPAFSHDLDAAALDAAFARLSAEERLRRTLGELFADRVALVSSFGADSAVVLHMVAAIRPETPVVFVDTGHLFAETIAYRDRLIERLGLRDVRTVSPDADDLAQQDGENFLWSSAPDLCCRVRKVLPLARALRGFDAWISGRKRYQATTRTKLPFVEQEAERIKINPLADWSAQDVLAYMSEHDLPRHDLVAKRYLSIGCIPCTSPVRPGEDARAGRWRGKAKTECGIHTDFVHAGDGI